MKIAHTQIARNKFLVTFDQNTTITITSWKEFLCTLMLCVTQDNQGHYTGINYDDRRTILDMLSAYQSKFSSLPTFITQKLHPPSYLVLTGSDGQQDYITQSLRSFCDDKQAITSQGAFVPGGGFLGPLLLLSFGGKSTINLQPSMACIYSNSIELGRLYVTTGHMNVDLPLDELLNFSLSEQEKTHISNLIGEIPRGDKLRWLRPKYIQNDQIITKILRCLIDRQLITFNPHPKATLLFNLMNKLDSTLNVTDQTLIDWTFKITEKAIQTHTPAFYDTSVLERFVPNDNSTEYFVNEMKNFIPAHELSKIQHMYETIAIFDQKIDVHTIKISHGTFYFYCALPQADFSAFLRSFSKKPTQDEKKKVTYSYEFTASPLLTLNPSHYFLPFHFYSVILPFIYQYYGADGFSLALSTMTDHIISNLIQQNIPKEEQQWSIEQLKEKYAINIRKYCERHPENCLSDRNFFETLQQHQHTSDQKWFEFEQNLIEQNRLKNEIKEPVATTQIATQESQLTLIQSNSKLNDYYTKFCQFISSHVLATKVINSGYVDINKSNAGLAADTAASLAGVLPVIGSVTGIVGVSVASVFNAVDARRRQNYLNQTTVFTSETIAVQFASSLAIRLILRTSCLLTQSLTEDNLTLLINDQWNTVLKILNQYTPEMRNLAFNCHPHVLNDICDQIMLEHETLIESMFSQLETQHNLLNQFIKRSINTAITEYIQAKRMLGHQTNIDEDRLLALSNIVQTNEDNVQSKVQTLYQYICDIKDQPPLQKGTLDYLLIDQLLKADHNNLLYCASKKGFALFNKDNVHYHLPLLKEKLRTIVENISISNELQNQEHYVKERKISFEAFS